MAAPKSYVDPGKSDVAPGKSYVATGKIRRGMPRQHSFEWFYIEIMFIKDITKHLRMSYETSYNVFANVYGDVFSSLSASAESST